MNKQQTHEHTNNHRPLPPAPPPRYRLRAQPLTWFFPPRLHPHAFPPLHATPPATPRALIPRCLLFALTAAPPSATSSSRGGGGGSGGNGGSGSSGGNSGSSFSLLMMSGTSQVVAVRMLEAWAVPCHVYQRSCFSRPGSSSSSSRISSQNGGQGQQGQGQGEGGVAGARDVEQEMEAVVAWCRQRMPWEQLLVQLQVGGQGEGEKGACWGVA